MLIVPYKKYLYKIKENSHISWTNDILQITYIRTQLNSKENHSWILSINKNMKRNTKDIYKKKKEYTEFATDHYYYQLNFHW